MTAPPEIHPGSLDFWQRYLAGAIPARSLPRDRKCLPPGEPRRAVREDPIDPGLLVQLHRLAAQEAYSLKEIILAGFVALLFRQTGHTDLVVALLDYTAQAGEVPTGSPPEFLPVRVKVQGDQSFGEVLESVRQGLSETSAHRPLPQELAPRATAGWVDASAGPGWPIGLAVAETGEGTGGSTPGVSEGAARLSPHVALGLAFASTDRSPGLRWAYDCLRFHHGYIEWFSRHFVELLRHAASDPETRLEDLTLTSEAEMAILRSWGQGTPPAGEPCFYHERLRVQAGRTPEAPAVVDGHRTLTFQELDRESSQLAHHLHSLGVGPDVVVAVCLERSADLVTTAFAVHKAGGCLFLLDPHSPLERLTFQIEWAQPTVIVTHRGGRLAQAAVSPKAVNLEEIRRTLAGLPAEPPPCRITSESTAFLFSTSGSTGRPKLVVQTFARFREAPKWDSTDVFILKSNSGTTFTTYEIFLLVTGGTLHVVPEAVGNDLRSIASFIGERGITHILVAPSTLAAFLSIDPPSTFDSLRTVVCMGEMLPPEVKQRFHERWRARLVVGYGCTEARGATARTCAPGEDPGWVDAGRVEHGMEVYVLDTKGRLAPVGIAGEIHIGGQIARGYLNDPPATAQRFIPSTYSLHPGARLFRTGDLGRWLPEGNLELLGRADNQVKIRGFRVELEEIEALLRQGPGVRDAAVVTRSNGSGEQQLLAFVAPATDAGTLDRRSIREFLRLRLPEPMVPATFLVVEQLPLTANGKVDRQALQLIPTEFGANEPRREPGTVTEIAVAAIWKEVLQSKEVGAEEDFFEAGGTSLTAVRLLARLEKEFKVRLSLADLLREPTVAGLAAHIAGDASTAKTDGSAGFRGARSGTPLFHIPGRDGIGFLPPDLAAVVGEIRPYFDGLQFPGLSDPESPPPSWEEIISDLVRQITDLRPSGAICLVGHSWAGVVAFELACRLARGGREIETVVLLDSWTQGNWRLRSWKEVIRELSRRTGEIPPGARARYLWRLLYNWAEPNVRRWASMRKSERTEAHAAHRLSESLTDTQKRWAWTDRASSEARLGKYSGRVDLFMATGVQDNEELRRARPALNGWGDLVQGELVVHRIPCFHHEVYRDPVHPAVLDGLRRVLSTSAKSAKAY